MKQVRLDWDTVRKIRRLLEEEAPGVQLAERFSVSPMTISDIKNRKTWQEEDEHDESKTSE